MLRLDRVLNKWAENWQTLASQGYKVSADLSGSTIPEVRRFICRLVRSHASGLHGLLIARHFPFPEDSARSRLLRRSGSADLP